MRRCEQDDSNTSHTVKGVIHEMIIHAKLERIKNKLDEDSSNISISQNIYNFLKSIKTDDINIKAMIKDMMVSYFIHNDKYATYLKNYFVNELNLDKKLIESLENKLRRRGVTSDFYKIMKKLFIFDDNGFLSSTNDKRPDYNEINANGFISDYSKPLCNKIQNTTGINSDIIESVFSVVANHSGVVGGLGVGKYEIALIIFFKGGKSAVKGDVMLNDKNVEVKVGNARLGSNLKNHADETQRFLKLTFDADTVTRNDAPMPVSVLEFMCDVVGATKQDASSTVVKNSLNFVEKNMMTLINYVTSTKKYNINLKKFVNFYTANFVSEIYGGDYKKYNSAFYNAFKSKDIQKDVIPLLAATSLILYKESEGFNIFIFISGTGKSALSINKFTEKGVDAAMRTFIKNGGKINGTTASSNPTGVRMKLGAK